MGKGYGRTTKNKVIKTLQYALVVTSGIMIVLMFIPTGLIGTAQTELTDRGLLGDGLFKQFWLTETFQALQIACWVSIVFLTLALFISWSACHGREDKCPACPPSSMKEPEHTLRPVLLLYIVFVLASALLLAVMGVYLQGRTADSGPKVRWLEDSNKGEVRRRQYMDIAKCCGWDDIFQYQLQPECTRAELLANPTTCRQSLDDIITKYVTPLGDACVAMGILLLIPWLIMVVLRVLDSRVTILDTAFSAGGEY